jgi:hypothetical protein
MRILISYEDAYRVYGDALERVLRGLRPEAEVASCRLAEIGEQLEGFNPPPSDFESPEHRGSGG